MNTEFFLHFVHQVERIFTLAVHLIHEDHHGRFTHSAYLHESSRLRLDTFGGVDHYDSAVYGRQGAESIFREILVTRGIEDVDMIATVVESHDRGRHRYSTLFLDLHPVGGSGLTNLITLHRSGYVNSTAV